MITGNYWLILHSIDEMICKLTKCFNEHIFITYRNEREIEDFVTLVRDDFFQNHPQYERLQSTIRIDVTTTHRSSNFHLHFEVDKFVIHKLI